MLACTQGLAFVFVNFATMLVYEPSLACEPKPLHKVSPNA